MALSSYISNASYLILMKAQNENLVIFPNTSHPFSLRSIGSMVKVAGEIFVNKFANVTCYNVNQLSQKR